MSAPITAPFTKLHPPRGGKAMKKRGTVADALETQFQEIATAGLAPGTSFRFFNEKDANGKPFRGAALTEEESELTLKGYLQKQTRAGVSGGSWELRQIVLHRWTLFFFIEEPGNTLSATLDLRYVIELLLGKEVGAEADANALELRGGGGLGAYLLRVPAASAPASPSSPPSKNREPTAEEWHDKILRTIARYGRAANCPIEKSSKLRGKLEVLGAALPASPAPAPKNSEAPPPAVAAAKVWQGSARERDWRTEDLRRLASAAMPMRSNAVKAALASGDARVMGTWLTFNDALSARLLCRAGFDFLALDLEHAAVDWERAAILFALVAEAGCVPLCRVPDGTAENIKRALDAGAFGVICPMVDSLAEAREIVEAAYYPPRGRRSVGPGAHFLNYGASDAEYKARANDSVAVILMAESPEGVASAPAWCALDGIDAVFVGPADLRAQMSRALPDGRGPTEEEFEVALGAVRAAGAAAGVATGIHAFTAADARARLAQGFRFVTVGSDAALLSGAARDMVETVGGLAGAGGGEWGGAPRVLGGAGAY